MTKKTLFFKFSVLVFTTIVFALTLHGISHAQTFTHIYVDAVNGTNGPGSGAAAKPYKSITYALLLSTRSNLPDPWHVHIRPGTYDADPVKPPSEREIFPLRLRSEMIFEGTTTATECIIDEQHTGPTPEPILTGTDIEGIIIRNLTIQNSLRTNGPGGIILHDSTGTKETPSTLEGCIVHNNRGGGVWSNMPFILTDNTFSNNGGAGVWTNKATAAMDNTFSDNRASGLHIEGNSTGDISENVFQSNGSSGLTIHGDLTGAISKNTCQNNKAGGFVVDGHIKANVTHNIFTSNRGRDYGGGFFVSTFTGDVTDNTFTGNSATYNGGGFFVYRTFTGDVTDNTFTGNSATVNGGGGGGFFAQTFTGDVTDNTFTGNSVTGAGGGFFVNTFTGDVTDNTFTGNSANHGGGFFVYPFTGDVTDNTFTGNSANYDGGGFYVKRPFTGDVTDNTFTRNTGDHAGGGFWLTELAGTVHHNIFDSNQGDYAAGFELYTSKNTVEVFNNIFFNNAARRTGGSVITRHATHFMNNLFMISDKLSEGVVSQGAAVWLNSPECQFHNNIFSGVQTAIVTEGSPDLPITHNLFHDIKVDFVESGGNNLGTDLAFWELVAVNASDNLEGAPLLVDPVTSRDFHLQAASPAINAGTNQFAPSDDFDGVARPVGKTVDIGPYEYGGKSPQTTDEEPPETDDKEPPVNRTPQRLEIVSGVDQKGSIKTALANPFVVKVSDRSGSALVGVAVTFAITAGGGSLSIERATTDADGRAESILTLGPNVGTNTVSVSVSGIQQTITFTAVSTPPETAAMIITGAITNTDGSPTEAGLPVTVTIGSTTQTAVSAAGGNYRVIFINLAGVVARSLDTVEVQVLREVTSESAEKTVQLSSEQIIAQKATIDLQFLPPTAAEYLLSVPSGISLIHVPLKVTEVDGVAKTITSIADLYDALGGASFVNFLITYDPKTGDWLAYSGTADKGTSGDKVLTDDTGILAGMIAPASIRLSGNPLGINGSSTITLNQGLNLVGLPLRDSRITRVSDLFALDGIGGNVPVVILTDNGQFKAVARPGDAGDIPITGGQSFILTAQRTATVSISGDGWTNTSGTAAAPSLAMKGIQVTDTTPVLALRGAIADEGNRLKGAKASG